MFQVPVALLRHRCHRRHHHDHQHCHWTTSAALAGKTLHKVVVVEEPKPPVQQEEHFFIVFKLSQARPQHLLLLIHLLFRLLLAAGVPPARLLRVPPAFSSNQSCQLCCFVKKYALKTLDFVYVSPDLCGKLAMQDTINPLNSRGLNSHCCERDPFFVIFVPIYIDVATSVLLFFSASPSVSPSPSSLDQNYSSTRFVLFVFFCSCASHRPGTFFSPSNRKKVLWYFLFSTLSNEHFMAQIKWLS